ncbi:DoxX family protein [Alkalihalobacterium elongatum]|uniref:DoxX family protein n=1 Tax=Alkalihalobacterium elongatum TaxID=2675466 RepID=UPI001C1FDBB3|nr:DoxX family protein [Alkalihalobacterium elongatum]
MINKQEIGGLILRVILGVVFLAHGAGKIQGGIANTAVWFDSIGLPGFLAYVVAISEFAGGIALILGLGTRLVGAIFVLIMLGAIIKVKLAAGFLDGYAYDLVLLAIAAHLSLNGSKLYSMDQLLFDGRGEGKKVA